MLSTEHALPSEMLAGLDMSIAVGVQSILLRLARFITRPSLVSGENSLEPVASCVTGR